MSTIKQFLVIDVEATCFENEPQDFISDIIEIGITSIDLSIRRIIESESILVIPTQSNISEYCTKLTGITEDDIINRGISFKEAMLYLNKKYKLQKNMWGSWGKYDDRMFIKQCERENVQYFFNNLHLNIKALFVYKYGFSSSIVKAMNFLQLPFEGRWHSGKDDSRNTARILLHLL